MMKLMRPWIGTCEETEACLSDHLEAGLAPQQERLVRRHLVWCRRCRMLYESLVRTVERVRALARVDEGVPAPSVVGVVTERIRHESS